MRDQMTNPAMMQSEPAPTLRDAIGGKAMQRGQAEAASQARKDLVTQLLAEIKAAEKKYEDGAFKRMREDMNFAFYGASEQWYKDDKYTVNIVQSHIRQKTGALYAKNPKAVAMPARKRMYKIWQGETSEITQAIQVLMTDPMNANSMALLQDVAQWRQIMQQIEDLGETLEIVYSYYQNEQQPDFKSQMKQLVVRATTCAVGYVEVGFQRAMGASPIVERKLGDFKSRLDRIEQLQADVQDNIGIANLGALKEELNLAVKGLQSEQEVILREGLVFDFPKSTALIPSLRCTQLKGWVGADFVAKRIYMTIDDIKRLYKKDITGGYIPYRPTSGNNYVETNTATSGATGRGSGIDCGLVKFYLCYSKKDGLVYPLVEGYNDFLAEPAAPDIKLEQFYPWFPLTFNAIESEREIFPMSDVRLIRHQQIEMNRSRQELNLHRKASRPKYATPSGMLEEEDIQKLKNSESNAVLGLRGLKPGQAVSDLIQPIQTKGVDPNLYDTSQVFSDIMHVVGSQEANLGSTSGSTATESSIAETSRLSSVESNIDELDDLLTSLARAGGQICMAELSQETVMEIVGPGAFWPILSLHQLQKELSLQIEAGSSGRPNRALELQNIQQLMPFLLQMPNVSHEWLLRNLVRRMDDRLDVDEALLSGMPSIIAQNAMAIGTANTQPPTGNAMNEPRNQGAMRGGSNAPAPSRPVNGQQGGMPGRMQPPV